MTGTRVGTTYDPLLAKVIAHGSDRGEALARLDRPFAESITLGVVINTSLLRTLLARREMRDGDLDTDLVARVLEESTTHESLTDVALRDVVARHYRNSKVLEIGKGTSEVQKIHIARLMGVE